jgi:hypothetical protein
MPDVIVRSFGSPKRTVDANTPAEAVGKTDGNFRVNGNVITNPSSYTLREGDVVDHQPQPKAAC